MGRITWLTAGAIALSISGCEQQPATDRVVAEQQAPKIILVSGVTGHQGGAVARALRRRGYAVRGLTRNPGSERAKSAAAAGIELVRGNFDDPASLDSALRSAYGAFLVTDYWEHGYDGEVRQGKAFADAALRAGIAHLVFSSVASADQHTGIPHFESKYEVEQYIRGLGIPFTILRPVAYMDNFEYRRDAIAAGKFVTPYSLDMNQQLIAVADIGRVAARAFDHPERWLGTATALAGDEHTVRETIAILSMVLRRPVEYINVPWDDYERAQGAEMTLMDRWIESVGYSVDISALRTRFPDLLTLDQYLTGAGWAAEENQGG